MKKFFALIFLTICSLSALWAQDIVKPMSPPQAVNDFAGLFNASQTQTLEDSLTLFKRTTSNEVVVVTVPDLGDYDVSQYAMELLRQWGVGNKEKNNGVVLLIKPRNQNGGGKVYIATGYGLEGALPDGRCGRIIDNEMMPYLKTGDYYAAAVAGTKAIRQAIQGEYTADQNQEGNAQMIFGIFMAILIFITIIVMTSKKGGQGTDENNSGSGSGGGWIPPIFMGGFGGGRGSSGGGFGGGFGGFGGGSSGGGGAGRSF